METLTGTLLERVDKLVHAAKTTGEWGDPRLSVTPTSLAIPQLVAQIEVSRDGRAEIALEVQKLSA